MDILKTEAVIITEHCSGLYSVYKIDVVRLVGYIRFFNGYVFYVCVGALVSCSPGTIHEDY